MSALDIRAILEHLPHRYPMLLVDRVVELEKGKRIVAYKNVTINEPFFVGHFPYLPVMPGVLQIEALAQAAGILSFQTMGRMSDASTVYYFVGIDSARFKRPVVPGDQLQLEVEIVRISRSIWKYRGRSTVEGQVCAEAELMCTLREIGGGAVPPLPLESAQMPGAGAVADTGAVADAGTSAPPNASGPASEPAAGAGTTGSTEGR